MPGKMARSAVHPPFQAAHVAATVRATRLPCQNAGKAQKIRTGSAVHMGNPGPCRATTKSDRRCVFAISSAVPTTRCGLPHDANQ
jgi:hypothetical protein